MLTFHTVGETDLVVADYAGELRSVDLVAIRTHLKSVIARHGQARLFVTYGDIEFGKIEPAAYWEDLKTAGIIKDLSRVAIVADQRWLQLITRAASHLVPAQVKVFDSTARDEAMAWVQAAD